MLDKIERLFAAIYALFPETEFRANQLMPLIAGRAALDPKCHELKRALQAIFGPTIAARTLGQWLGRHRDTEAGPYRLAGDRKGFWTVFRPASVEELERENAQYMRQVTAKRRKAARTLEGQIRLLEKDLALVEKLNAPKKEDGRTVYHRNERLARELAEKKERERLEKKSVYLAPHVGFFLMENVATRTVANLCQLGFQASIGYAGQQKFVAHVDGEFDRETLQKFAFRHLLKVFDVVGPVAKRPGKEPEQIWDQRLQTWVFAPTAAMPLGYEPAAHALAKAARAFDRAEGPQAIRLAPMASWSPFNY